MRRSAVGRAILRWQPFLRQYDRLTLLTMSIPYLDLPYFLPGDPVDEHLAEFRRVAR